MMFSDVQWFDVYPIEPTRVNFLEKPWKTTLSTLYIN